MHLFLRRLNPIYQNLIIGTAFAFGLLVFRIQFSSEGKFAFLVWNLFLAFVPLGIALFMKRKSAANNRKLWPMFPLFLAWFLFLPNAPYILTDLFHLKQKSMPLWFDLILILSFAWTGLIAGIVSLHVMKENLMRYFSHNISMMIIVLSILASGFGIYLGRYLRWNSWDVIHAPKGILKDVLSPLINPFDNLQTIGMTLSFAFFMLLVYSTIKVSDTRILIK